MKKIVVTGPECSGKTTLVESLSQKFKEEVVFEHAREYLKTISGKYQLNDLINIAKGQIEKERKVQVSSYLICDTDILTIQIWAEDKFNKTVEEINNLYAKPDLYLLCKPDIPWQFDPLREDENNREKIYQKYNQAILQLKVPFIEVEGSAEKRIKFSIKAIQKI